MKRHPSLESLQSTARTTALLTLLTLLQGSFAFAAEKPGTLPLTRQLQMSACYVKEDVDQAWNLKVVGDMPRGPGIYAIVYNEAGDVVWRTAIPFGTHTEEKPFVARVPADGKAQQYVIKLVGQQDNLNGMRLPLTDLPYEVYGDYGYSFGQGVGKVQRMVAFQVPDTEPVHFSGWRGNYRILDSEGNVVMDSKDHTLKMGDPLKKSDERNFEVVVTNLSPGQTYWLEPYDVMYLNVLGRNLYLTFDPQRWFEPKLSWTLGDRPWWKGMP